jgi:catechol 2,3-dioxygenase-like lactoylglutathione lyase family enzyme
MLRSMTSTSSVTTTSASPSARPSSSGFHHVAYACRDLVATTTFYETLGFPLVHTEVSGVQDHFLRHVFFDTGDGSCIAFFDVHGVGEQEDWRSDISTGNGLPVWVNHVAFRATSERQEEVRTRMTAAGHVPLMELDHEWCHSLYYQDPNGIMVEFCRDTPGFVADPEAAHQLIHSIPGPTPKPSTSAGK